MKTTSPKIRPNSIHTTTKVEYYKRVFSRCQLCGQPSEEVHHIVPKSKGGVDTFKNYISLCRNCHRKLHLHRNWKSHQAELLTYKFYDEDKLLGVTSDETEEEEFLLLLKQYLDSGEQASNV